MTCSRILREQGKPYPRTCPVHGLRGCQSPDAIPLVIPEHELEQKRLEFVEWQLSEHFDIGDVDYETVEKFIESCSVTMVPAIVSAAVKAAVRSGCFRNSLAVIRFVATAMEEQQCALTAPPQEVRASVASNHPAAGTLRRIYPSWVCQDCGTRYGRGRLNEYATWHEGRCGICGDPRAVTEPRDFGHLDLTDWEPNP